MQISRGFALFISVIFCSFHAQSGSNANTDCPSSILSDTCVLEAGIPFQESKELDGDQDVFAFDLSKISQIELSSRSSYMQRATLFAIDSDGEQRQIRLLQNLSDANIGGNNFSHQMSLAAGSYRVKFDDVSPTTSGLYSITLTFGDSDQDGVTDDLDFYHLDANCSMESDGNGNQCYITWLNQQNITSVATDADSEKVYFVVDGQNAIYTLDSTTGHFDEPLAVQPGLESIVYDENNDRLILVYANEFGYLPESGDFSAIATVEEGIHKLRKVGDYFLIVNKGTGYGNRAYYLYNDQGESTSTYDSYYYTSTTTGFSRANNKIFHFRDGISPNDVYYLTVNAEEGTFGESLESPYHGDYSIYGPIIASDNGTYVLLGSGDIYRQSDLNWVGSIGGSITGGFWTADDELVAFSQRNEAELILKRFDSNFREIEVRELGFSPEFTITQNDAYLFIGHGQDALQLQTYVPDNDIDNDGVNNVDDAFPNDIAASEDSDGDGYPDTWNEGYSEADSTTGLTIDVFPVDSLCWLDEHGIDGVCDYDTRMPDFTPDRIVVTEDGSQYLLSVDNEAIYKWDAELSRYSSPYLLQNLESSPQTMAYSETHQRLYVGTTNGNIVYFDTSSDSGLYTDFYATSTGVYGLASVGNYLLAQDYSGAWATHYIIDENGGLTDSADWNYYSRVYAWNRQLSRVYFFRDDTSPNDLHYEDIDQTTGLISGSGETPYHSSNYVRPPIVISQDGQKVLLGNGRIFDATSLEEIQELELEFSAALWTVDYLIVGSNNNVQLLSDNDYSLETSFAIAGDVVSLSLQENGNAVVGFIQNGDTHFTILRLADADNDGMPAWWEEQYGLDDSDASDANRDPDADGLTNLQEFTHKTLPNIADTDDDGLLDGDEVNEHNTDPNTADTDGDGLNDGEEVNTHQTNPLSTDTDEDGLSDADEVNLHNTNPLSTDTDSDGMSDQYEVIYGLDPTLDDSTLDADSDGLSNIEEQALGTAPNNDDTDSDNVIDGDEVNTHATNPLNRDSDGDKMPDGYEIDNAFDPLLDDASNDIDEDGFSNMEEYFLNTDPRNASSVPQPGAWTSFQGGNRRDGFIPVSLNFENANERWRITNSNMFYQVVSDGTSAYFTSEDYNNGKIYSVNTVTGEIQWQRDYETVYQFSPITISDSSLYAGNRWGDYYFRGFNRDSGAFLFRGDNTFDTNNNAAAIIGDISIIYGEYYLYAYNSLGELLWQKDYDGRAEKMSVTTDGEHVFLVYDAQLELVNVETGEVDKQISLDREEVSSYYYQYSSLVLGTDNNVLIVYEDELINVNLNEERVSWRVNSNYQQQPAVRYGEVFIVHNGLLRVFDEISGELLRSWEAPNGYSLEPDLVLTRTHLITRSYYNTFAINFSDFSVDYTSDESGAISVSNNGALYIANNAGITAISAGSDTDSDGLPDWWENSYGLDRNNALDATLDTDEDGLSNLEEFNNNTIPTDNDTDDDNLLDGDEVNTHGTSPINADSDADGVDDGVEVTEYGTDPLATDSDNDGLDDYEEIVIYESNPLSSDSDNDGMGDAYEVEHGLLINEDDSDADADTDGLSNLEELENGTDPNVADTDKDGLRDGDEVNTHETDPLHHDSDGDRILDGWEIDNDYDPNNASDASNDRDGDGFSAVEEYLFETDINDSADFPQYQPWATHQSSAKHNGFNLLNTLVNSDSESAMWTLQTDNNVSGMSAANGKIFVAFNSRRITSYNAYSGDLIWTKNESQRHSINPPAYANGKVFFQTGGHSDSFLWALDEHNGELLSQSAYGNQWSNYHAPTPYGDNVYVAGGYYGGIYGFSQDGEELFFNDIEQVDGWTPAVDENYAYSMTRGNLRGYNKETGSIEFVLDVNAMVSQDSYGDTNTVLLADYNRAIVHNAGYLVAIDLHSNELAWSVLINSNYYGNFEKAASHGAVYAIVNGLLVAYDAFNGDRLWTIESPNGYSFNSNIALSRDSLFVSTDTATYAYDLNNPGDPVWQMATPGNLVLSEGILYVYRNQQISAFNFDGDLDGDGMPDFYEQANGFDPNDAADANEDADTDGLSNSDEFNYGTDPNTPDSDTDGLSDGAEVNDYGTDPLDSDSDKDSLDDGEEVNTHDTDPNDADSDDDGFTDGQEINIYFTDPNDADSAPEAITSLNETFESDSVTAAWTHTSESDADWTIVDELSSSGAQSFKSGDVGDNQESTVELSLLFANGTFSFDAYVGSETCCDALEVYLDDELQFRIVERSWQTYTIAIVAGERTIRFRYQKDGSVSRNEDAAYLDNVAFSIE